MLKHDDINITSRFGNLDNMITWFTSSKMFLVSIKESIEKRLRSLPITPSEKSCLNFLEWSLF